MNAQADAVPFEIGAGRARHMAARDHVRRWQAMLRTLYLLQLALLQARAFGTSAPLSQQDQTALRSIDESNARVLQEMAEYFDVQYTGQVPTQPVLIELPQISALEMETHTGSLLALGQEMAAILNRVRDEMLATPFFSAES